MLSVIEVYGFAHPLGPCAQSVPGAGPTAGPAAGTGGPVAAAVGASFPVLQRTKCPQPETGGVELPFLLSAEVTSSTIAGLMMPHDFINIIRTITRNIQQSNQNYSVTGIVDCCFC